MTLRFAPAHVSGGDRDVLLRLGHSSEALPSAVADSLLARGSAEGNLALLAGGALAVTTGQQAGLFTGPIFSMHKALTAAALAGQLTARLKRPVVPVFWVAGDDHDFAEINHCFVHTDAGATERIVLRERPVEAPMLPAYREVVGPAGDAALSRLESLLPPSDSRTEAVEWLARAYRADHSMAESYAQAMAEVLGPFGVVVARGWDARLKRAARRVMLQALREAPALEAALHQRAEALRGQGRDVPVEIGRDLTLLMLEGPAGRDRLRVTGPGRFAGRRSHDELTLAEIERIADDDSVRLSPNVLLRPVVEAAVFPTLAYVAGPGELKYLAQAEPLFELLGVSRQAFVPRAGGALVDQKVDKVLARYDLTVDDLAHPSHELAARVASDDLPADVVAGLARLRASLHEGYAELQRAAMAVERTLERPVENTRNQALLRLERIEKKITAALARRNDSALQRLARAREALYPTGAPQERVITLASFSGRHGRAALDAAWAAARDHAGGLVQASPGR